MYIMFAVIQFRYFFDPQATIDYVAGLTRAQYAVRGFGELLFITCLNFVLIAVGMRITKQKDGKSRGYLKVLYALLIVFNFIIMASSHIRMQCYESAYGYTVARFVSHSFMVLLIGFNAVMLVRVFCEKLRVARLFIVAALIYFCVLTAINPERFVARENIGRYQATGKIDTVYLFSLPGGALSEACDFAEAHPEMFDTYAKERAQERLESYCGLHSKEWQSLNIAERTAYAKLAKLVGP